MKIAIVDDLKLDAEQLSHLILSYMKEHRIPTAAPEIFPNGETFLASFTVGSFDIVFLDIYMDGLSGMETAQKLRTLDASCRIVFVTTSPDFAVDSYDVNAAFYLLKPVTMERVSKALERCHLSAAEAEVSVFIYHRLSAGRACRCFLHLSGALRIQLFLLGDRAGYPSPLFMQYLFHGKGNDPDHRGAFFRINPVFLEYGVAAPRFCNPDPSAFNWKYPKRHHHSRRTAGAVHAFDLHVFNQSFHDPVYPTAQGTSGSQCPQ